MPQVFVCKWLLTMGIMVQLSSRGTSAANPILPQQSAICAPFLSKNKDDTDGGYLFSSPGYDDKKSYPNKTDCIRVLKASSPVKVISLDFRDMFHIEPSAGCEYDFLEIRDGPYGFSPALDNEKVRFCGKKFPLNGKKILSSGQFMWLRFYSDNTIQHRGMKAVYEFVPNTEVAAERRQAKCRVPVRLTHVKKLTEDSFPQGYLSQKTDDGGQFDCTFDIESTVTKQMFVYTKIKEFEKGTCEDAFMEAYDGFTIPPVGGKPGLINQKVCLGKIEIIKWTSTTPRMVVRSFSKNHLHFPRFSLTMTPITKAPCDNGWFACGDGFCVDKKLVCDDSHNCPNSRDEQECAGKTKKETKKEEEEEQNPGQSQEKDKLVPYHYIILGTIGALLCVFILICMFITIRQRRIDLRNRRRDEMLRRSSEAQRHFQQQQQESQSPHSLRRDLHTPSSLEGNRLLEYTTGGGRSAAAETASLGRLNKQNGVVLMGGSGMGMKQMPSGPPHSSTLPGNMNPGPSSSVFYDPRTVHSSRVGKYLSVPNPTSGPTEEDECLDSPIDPIIAQSSSTEPPRCKIHGDVYQRDGHQPIIHRSDSAPSKAFFRLGSATPPPTRSGANTPSHQRQESPSPEQYPPRRDAQYYPSPGSSDYHPQSAAAAPSGYHPQAVGTSEYHHHPAHNEQQHQRQSYYPSSSPVPAYSLHSISGGPAFEEEDNQPCICRHREEGHAPHPMVRQSSLGTPRSLRRKVYDT